jgi:2-C-methyl-D-erythritol 4-phosphate cytidylyltransferase
MSTGFVAVLRTELTEHAGPAEHAELTAAGATAVLTWSELLTCAQPDDAAVVLFDHDDDVGPDLLGLLDRLAATDDALDRGTGGTVIVTTRPVTDTLKLVDARGTLTGTADRDDHRFLCTPIALRLRLLRRVAAELDTPTPIAVLDALAARGVTILGTA